MFEFQPTNAEFRAAIGEAAYARLTEFGRRQAELAALYENRDELCRSLGFKSYAAYLDSDLWAGIKKAVLKRDKKKCVRCGHGCATVHHRCYSLAVLTGEDLEPLASFCSGCHTLVHWSEDGVERFVDEWDGILAA